MGSGPGDPLDDQAAQHSAGLVRHFGSGTRPQAQHLPRSGTAACMITPHSRCRDPGNEARSWTLCGALTDGHPLDHQSAVRSAGPVRQFGFGTRHPSRPIHRLGSPGRGPQQRDVPPPHGYGPVPSAAGAPRPGTGPAACSRGRPDGRPPAACWYLAVTRGRRSASAGDQVRVARGRVAGDRRRGCGAAAATPAAAGAAITGGEGDGGTGVLERSAQDVPIGRDDAR